MSSTHLDPPNRSNLRCRRQSAETRFASWRETAVSAQRLRKEIHHLSHGSGSLAPPKRHLTLTPAALAHQAQPTIPIASDLNQD